MKQFLTVLSKRFVRDKSGAASTEFAMIIPAFATMLLGTFEAGDALCQRATLQHAINVASRAAMLSAPAGGDPTGMSQAQIIETAKEKLATLVDDEVSITVTYGEESGVPIATLKATKGNKISIPFAHPISYNVSAKMVVPRGDM